MAMALSPYWSRIPHLSIDLDGFKSINDIADHAAENLILKQAPECMRSRIRASDFVAIFGGNECVIVLISLQSYEGTHRIGDKIVESMTALRIANHDVFRISAGIGICYLPHREIVSIEDAIKAADMLMSISKRTGKGKFIAQFIGV
jgi:diguanylate cyclase (GGDEF)-like protein